jgi:hypothetical protein
MAEEPRSWWQTIPGTITAIATLIGAITALIIALCDTGIICPPKADSPTTVVVPDVVYKSLEEAQTILKESGLKPNSGNDTTGTVVSQEPKAGARMSKGSIVNLDVATKPRQVINISGRWYSGDFIYEFTQQENTFTFTGQNRRTGVKAQGQGTVDEGRQITITYKTDRPSTGSATGTVSADASQIPLMVKDSQLGQSDIVLSRSSDPLENQ